MKKNEDDEEEHQLSEQQAADQSEQWIRKWMITEQQTAAPC